MGAEMFVVGGGKRGSRAAEPRLPARTGSGWQVGGGWVGCILGDFKEKTGRLLGLGPRFSSLWTLPVYLFKGLCWRGPHMKGLGVT